MSNYRKRPSALSSFVAPGATLLLAGLVFIGLWAGGVIQLGSAPATGPSRPKQPAGTVAVVMNPRPIAAYTRITREHLWNTEYGGFDFAYLPAAQVTSNVIARWGDVIGRVLKHNKPAKYDFTEDDFYPKGTREGYTAGIPPGKRGLRIELDKLPGLANLARGDRFDVVSTIPVDPASFTSLPLGGAFKAQVALQSGLTNMKKQASVKVIAQDALVVQSATLREVPTASASLMGGLETRKKPVIEIVVAIAPAEVGPLTEALAVSAQLECVLRSGRPDDPDEPLPGHTPHGPFSGAADGASLDPNDPLQHKLGVIEEIKGTEHSFEAAPKAVK
jgi:Flp pilus assembly protein CpaB